MRKSWKAFLAASILLLALAQPSVAADVYEFKISVDTVMDHPRNQSLVIFMENIKKRSNGKLSATLYHSSQLYVDKAVPKALTLGTLDMGAPGIWQLSSYDINADVTSLPMFYGQPPDAARTLVDGIWGKKLSESLEKKMGVLILGRYYELGYLNTFTCKKPIMKLEDWKGLKIRYPGAPVHATRLQALGASPMLIPYADLPMALMQGTVDGLLSGFKTVEAVKLEEAGMKYAIDDYWSVLHYVPMVSKKFWSSLPKDLQKIMEDEWEKHVADERKLSVVMQDEAKVALEKRGVKIYSPSKEELAKWREQSMVAQEPFIKKEGMDMELVNKAKELLGVR